MQVYRGIAEKTAGKWSMTEPYTSEDELRDELRGLEFDEVITSDWLVVDYDDTDETKLERYKAYVCCRNLGFSHFEAIPKVEEYELMRLLVKRM